MAHFAGLGCRNEHKNSRQNMPGCFFFICCETPVRFPNLAVLPTTNPPQETAAQPCGHAGEEEEEEE